VTLNVELEWPNGKPKVKDRPRFGGGRVYTPAATAKVEKALADQWETQGLPKFDGPIKVTLHFTNTHIFIEVDDCDDYENRSLRGDVDNYRKNVNDALNGVAWVDDKQIVCQVAEKI